MLRITVLSAGMTCLLMAGCASVTSEMLARPGLASGPSQGKDVGVIRYLAQGSPSDIQLRQQDANVKMSNACQDKYRVVSTSVNVSGSINHYSGPNRYGYGRYGAGGGYYNPGYYRSVNATSGSVSTSTTSYIYIQFVCL